MLNCCRPCDCDEYCPCCGRRKQKTYSWPYSWPTYVEPRRWYPQDYPQVGRPYNPGNPRWTITY